jgi:hypothetical protein
VQQGNKNAKTNDVRYRIMLILWCAQLMSIGFLFFLSLFLGPQVDTEISNEPGSQPSPVLIGALTAMGILLVILSFAVKRKFLALSVEKQSVDLVQKALVIACAMCEASALLGLLERLLIGNHDYYLLFLIAAIGTTLHFPRREHLLSATYKTSPDGAAS